ncbi:rhomboid family intramembrane serine protease [Paracoccus zhejiangensis]|uniref:Rhomboid family intramembrane serine protease n=1 Tax=Paracoccus zhejiangensis TaxID=1077935 RepID=A0A2H5F311_9RHOB|nr:rhomboid family intramembrane serine protease [Paracoccus zhejiangensis]AUH65940.1 rhomboid family intramembrane serine protease [Paracoccus zhejiangensis]
MRHGLNESPINQLPWVVWVLALPMIAGELVFGLGQYGLIGGQQGIALRMNAIEWSAFVPEFIERMLAIGAVDFGHLYRIVTYPFVHYSFTHALFVVVFTLALGNMVAANFRPVAVLALFFGSAIGGALVYTGFAMAYEGRVGPLIGGYPAVYGLVGAFTFLLWTRLAAVHANRMRAFTLIGMLLLFQLVFGLLFGNAGYGWIAELAGFACGFGLSFLLVDGGMSRALRQLRQR